MKTLTIILDKKKGLFKVNMGSRIFLNFNIAMVKNNNMSTIAYNFMFILRILYRCGIVKPLKKF